MTPLATASALRRVIMIAADLDRTARFYTEALGAEIVSRAPLVDRGWLHVLGLDDRAVEHLLMRLGQDEVAVLAVDPPVAPYPPGSTATDLWFQHIAIVVDDMARAHAQVQAAGAVPISRHGPVQLPPSAGGVRAFKFRDPDGHPLELLWFPPGSGPARWRADAHGRLIRGIDHSALDVGDVARSVAFYGATFGLARTAASVNRGATQASLDDVGDDVVDVVALAARQPTPHVELLGYRTGPRRPVPGDSGPADIAATRLVLTVADAAPLAAMASMAVLDDGRRAVALADSDGHRLIAVEDRPSLPGQKP